MLPKPEKKSKKNKDPEQLDLVDTLSDADRIRKKRFFTVIYLLLTVGLSLTFLLYREYKNFNFSQFKLPEISKKKPSSSVSKPKSFFPKDWQVQIISPDIQSNNFSIPSDLKPNPSPYAKKYLPGGVSVTEMTKTNPDFLEILSEINNPKYNLKIYVLIPGKTQFTNEDIDNYSQSVRDLYWYLANEQTLE